MRIAYFEKMEQLQSNAPLFHFSLKLLIYIVNKKILKGIIKCRSENI